MSVRSWLWLVALAGMWGSSFLFIRLGLEGFAPPQVVLGRLTVGTVVLAAIVWATGARWPRDRRVWAHLALMGLVANVVPWLLLVWGQQFVASGLAGVLTATAPLFTALFAAAALADERLPWRRALGILVGFAGVVVIVDPVGAGAADPLTASIPGQLACLGTAACYGVGFTYTRRYLANHGHSPLALAAGQLGSGAVLLWLAAPLVATAPVRADGLAVASVGALGLIGTGLAYAVYYRLLGELGATRTSTAVYLVPVVAVTLGVVLLGESVTPTMLVGAAIVIVGVAMVQRRGRAASPPAVTPESSGPPTG